jgi:hypothetical protein
VDGNLQWHSLLVSAVRVSVSTPFLYLVIRFLLRRLRLRRLRLRLRRLRLRRLRLRLRLLSPYSEYRLTSVCEQPVFFPCAFFLLLCLITMRVFSLDVHRVFDGCVVFTLQDTLRSRAIVRTFPSNYHRLVQCHSNCCVRLVFATHGSGTGVVGGWYRGPQLHSVTSSLLNNAFRVCDRLLILFLTPFSEPI